MEYCYLEYWICWISYRKEFTGLLVLHLLPVLNHYRNVASLSLFYSIGITLVDNHLNWFNQFHFLILKGGLLVILLDCIIFLSPFLDVRRMSMSIVSFLPQLDSSAHRMLSFDP